VDSGRVQAAGRKDTLYTRAHVAISDITIEGSKLIVETRDLFKNEYCLNDLMNEVELINAHLVKNGYTKIEIIPRYKGSDAEELTEENLESSERATTQQMK
jgi:hypothetical protein